MTRPIIDPEISKQCPALTADELAALRDSLLAEGCRDALVVWAETGILLDGHNRLAICEELGLPYQTTALSFPDRLSAMIWVLTNQSARRNLTDDRRAVVAAELAELLSERAKRERAKAAVASREWRPVIKPILSAASADKIEPTDTRTQAAKTAGVSERKVRQAQTVKRAAPDLSDKVAEGELRLSQAVREVRKREQKARLAAMPEAADTEAFRLIHTSIEDAELEPGSIDVIVTDPPYQAEYVPLYEVLAAKAAVWLKPGGYLLAMAGQSYLPAIITSMERHLKYHWTIAYLTPGGQSAQLWQRKVNTFWKPVLWFVKGTYEGRWIGDVAHSTVNDNDKQYHGWGQSESGMADLIDRLTQPGQIICDPFLGGGTTAVVSIAHKRKFIGMDKDADAIATTRKRLYEVLNA